MAVGFPTKTTYVNGDVFSASDINDTNGTLNLLTTSTLSLAAGKNVVINGAMDFFQRSTSVSPVGANYFSADRWATWINAGSGTLAQTTASIPADFNYGFRFTSSASNSTCNFYHTIESLNSVPLAGKTVTLSFYAGGTAGKSFNAQILTSTTTDATFTSGFTQQAVTAVTLTATLTRYTLTATIPSSAKTIQVLFAAQAIAGVGYNSTEFVTFTGVQLELGSFATTFSRAGGTIQGELSACQRYYYKSNTTTVRQYNNSASLCNVPLTNPTTMRVTPSSSVVTAPGMTNASAFNVFATNTTNINYQFLVTIVGTGLIDQNGVYEFSAEF